MASYLSMVQSISLERGPVGFRPNAPMTYNTCKGSREERFAEASWKNGATPVGTHPTRDRSAGQH
jgi:hypothetical protein